ncbi:MAG: hypothetical protein OXE81_10490 [Gammaproteobacteria bacterium]|nr:hypothetical protein [Gammaproteobacteria bacterium]MCY4278243.1 hypothetical protein [Gammaproteobacteria bacterium]
MRTRQSRNLPICKTYAYEEDESVLGSPFYVMERIEGQVPHDQPSYHSSGSLTELDPEQQAALPHVVAWRSCFWSIAS